MRKNNTKAKVGKEKKYCIGCKKERVLTAFYNTNSPMFADGKVPFCKDCLMEMVNVNDLESVKNILRQIDKPFIQNVWVKSLESNNPFGIYNKMIGSLQQYKGMTWKDSVEEKPQRELPKSNGQTVVIDESDMENALLDFKVTREMVMRWGADHEPEDYFTLENFHTRMNESYDIETASHEDYLEQICLVRLEAHRARKERRFGDYTKIMKIYDDLMGSAKFKATQRSASDKTGGMQTFGEIYEFIEKQGFIPRWVNDEPMDIVDKTEQNLMEWTKKLVLGDPNLASIVEATIQKMAQKEAGFAEVESGDEEGMDEGYEYDEMYYVGEEEEDDK